MFGAFAGIIPIFVALSTFGGVNGIIFTSARLFATGSQDGHLPPFFSLFHVHKQTPIPSLIFSCIASVLMLCSTDIFELISYFSQILWLSVAGSIAGMLWLRYKKPEMARPIRVNLALPIIFITSCLILVISSWVSKPMHFVLGMLITLTGLPVYLIKTHCKGHFRLLGEFGNVFEKYCQIIFNSVYIENPDSV